jgi:hypothetical protein
MSQMSLFLFGAIMMGFGIASAFFFKFWSETRDRLFLLFGVAFGILAIERLVLGLFAETGEHRVYYFRIIAFGLILLGILDKNRDEKRRRR